MKEILISKNQITMVDDEDYIYLNKYKWCFSSQGYVVRNSSRKLGKQKTIRMHRLLLNVTDPKIMVDHIDGNPLNNQKSNLRNCTPSQNQANKKKTRKNSSGYKGVYWVKSRKSWVAHIEVNGRCIYAGCGKTAKDAAIKYNEAAKKYFGEFAKLNTLG